MRLTTTSLFRISAIALSIAMAPLLAMTIARAIWPFGFQRLTRDLAAIAGIHPLSGALSSLGVLLWWSSAVVWLFTALLLRLHDRHVPIGLALSSSALSAYLALDDLFQIHEYLLPRHLGIAEPVVLILLALATAQYLYHYRRDLWQRDALLLLASLALLAASVITDAIPQATMAALRDWAYLIEDGLKWIGICFWLTFGVVRCQADLRRTFSLAPSAERQPEEAGTRCIRHANAATYLGAHPESPTGGTVESCRKHLT